MELWFGVTMSADEELDTLLDGAFDQALRGAWIRWWIRLAIGITVVTLVVIRWPHLWWIALTYPPFPILSALALVRVRRKGFQRPAEEE